MNNNNDNEQLARMGLAAMLPGMVYAMEQLQRFIDEVRERIGAEPMTAAPAKHDGDLIDKAEALKQFRITKAQFDRWKRKLGIEMAGRSDNVGTRAFYRRSDIEQMCKAIPAKNRSGRTTANGYWATMTPEERKAEIRRRLTGTSKTKQRVNGVARDYGTTV